jgi:hypothetical protein
MPLRLGIRSGQLEDEVGLAGAGETTDESYTSNHDSRFGIPYPSIGQELVGIVDGDGYLER